MLRDQPKLVETIEAIEQRVHDLRLLMLSPNPNTAALLAKIRGIHRAVESLGHELAVSIALET